MVFDRAKNCEFDHHDRHSNFLINDPVKWKKVNSCIDRNGARQYKQYRRDTEMGSISGARGQSQLSANWVEHVTYLNGPYTVVAYRRKSVYPTIYLEGSYLSFCLNQQGNPQLWYVWRGNLTEMWKRDAWIRLPLGAPRSSFQKLIFTVFCEDIRK